MAGQTAEDGHETQEAVYWDDQGHWTQRNRLTKKQWEKVCALVRGGIPPELRARVWPDLCGASRRRTNLG